jgi:hypothetical protein
VTISSLVTQSEMLFASGKMRPHAVSIVVCHCSVFDAVYGVQLRQWLRQHWNSNGGREEHHGISRIGHNPDGKAATVLRHRNLLRWIDEIPANRHDMELFQHSRGHGG